MTGALKCVSCAEWFDTCGRLRSGVECVQLAQAAWLCTSTSGTSQVEPLARQLNSAVPLSLCASPSPLCPHNNTALPALLCPQQQQQARILNNTDVSSGFLTVWRPAPDGSGKLVPVQLPTGSVRASLGYLSTFEDVWAYVQFLRRNYKDGGTQSNANAASTAAEAAAAGAAAGSQRVMVE